MKHSIVGHSGFRSDPYFLEQREISQEHPGNKMKLIIHREDCDPGGVSVDLRAGVMFDGRAWRIRRCESGMPENCTAEWEITGLNRRLFQTSWRTYKYS